MSYVTLIMTRVPLVEIKYGSKSGRWGRMIMVVGPKVNAVQIGGDRGSVNQSPNSAPINFGHASYLMQTDGKPIESMTEFDTLERFRHESNGFYMQTRPQPAQPYRLTMFDSNTIKDFKKDHYKGANINGHCLKVHGHGYVKKGTQNEAGILVHEAPHPGWLTGCIAPRLPNNRGSNALDASHAAMDMIFRAMGGFSKGKEAGLIVLDW